MTEREMWNLYIQNNHVKNKTYDAWSFGEEPLLANKLAKLVLTGIKTATASAYELYEIENTQLPSVNDLNIILDSCNRAICIIKTTKVYSCQFLKVSEKHAFKEGEGDRSISYWREIHKNFFSTELKTHNIDFEEKTLIVCEEFKVVFK